MGILDGESRAVLSSIRVSPQKLNLVATVIRQMDTKAALTYLKFCKKRSARDVYKALYSAVSNAENNHGMDPSLLYVKESCVGAGIVIKRFHARAKGRSSSIRKRFSRLSITVAERKE